MLPVISTRPLSNFELTLSPDGTRVGNHRCSNLLDFNEIQTGHGFITDSTKNPEIIGETSPYQYSVGMRSANSLRFYRNLNLEACLWEFNSYYDMSELLNTCGGSVGTDGQVSCTDTFTTVMMESSSLLFELCCPLIKKDMLCLACFVTLHHKSVKIGIKELHCSHFIFFVFCPIWSFFRCRF